MIGDSPWLDAFLRLAVVVALITVTTLVLIYLERKLIGRMQMRLGPMHTGPYGLLQSIADAIKLMSKEDVRPAMADRWTFELAPFVVFVPVVLAFVALPFTASLFVRHMDLGLFYIVAVGSLPIVGLLMAGWGSDNKYALLGGVRSAAQLISYELPLVLGVLAVALVAGSLDLLEIVDQQGRVPFIVWQPLGFMIVMVAMVAELYRNPFDIPVAESEVVGGPFVEYSGIRWGMFFLAEYANLILLSVLGAVVFLGGWEWPLGSSLGWGWQVSLMLLKTSLLIFIFFWLRASLPRLRIDQLMNFCWKVLLPFAFLQIVLNGLVVAYDWPDWTLLALSAPVAGLMMNLVYRSVRRPLARQRILARRMAYDRAP
ncbi:MAG TPA: NADH-quinone oxidoreductase subunit NuoH [Dehalococcoidia bacterium]|nr:NADH-quinone oxidoreductase subunit NuoH [Dehalococcoidia bacterium]